MKILKASLFFLLFLSIIIVSTTSCNKEVEGCTDPWAENYNADADTDDGNCTYARDKFIGTYNVDENCPSALFTYTINITNSVSNKEAILISNFGNYSIDVNAGVSISGKDISINETQGGLTFLGSGSIVEDTLTITYSTSTGGVVITSDCVKTCVKQ